MERAMKHVKELWGRNMSREKLQMHFKNSASMFKVPSDSHRLDNQRSKVSKKERLNISIYFIYIYIWVHYPWPNFYGAAVGRSH